MPATWALGAGTSPPLQDFNNEKARGREGRCPPSNRDLKRSHHCPLAPLPSFPPCKTPAPPLMQPKTKTPPPQALGKTLDEIKIEMLLLAF